jgi:phosphate transport system substrate-binding protein
MRTRSIVALLLGMACVQAAWPQSLVRADGSSTVFPVTEAVGRAFQVASRGTTRVIVGISGTRGGFRKFCNGETDLQDASRAILPEEAEACRASGVRYSEIPVAFDGITVVVNPRNTWASALTLEQLKRIWEPQAQGKVTLWSDVDPAWPREPLMLFAPGPDSGTFEYFTEVVVGRSRATRADYLSSEDDNALARGIEGNVYALGYIPYSYYASRAKTLKALAIDSGGGPVEPAISTIASHQYVPLSRPLFLYVSEQSARRVEVRGFVEFLLTQGAPLIREANYLPLSEAKYSTALRQFQSRTSTR